MGNNDYLQQILNSQTLTNDSGELKSLQKHRKDVEDLIRGEFSSSALSIRYGGSKAKGTMIKEAYDLDILCYFDHDDESPGETLEEIYDSIRKLLSTQYYVEQKASALRLKDKNTSNYAVDFHIDVVPGRFIDDSRNDVFLYQASGEKKRLKTNPNIHITYVKNSGHTEAIRLLKLWRVRNGLSIKHFALELLIIEILKGKGSNNLTGQLETVWTIFRDKIDEISIEDPANPTGNDLSALLDYTIRSELSSVAANTLNLIETSGWEAVFGPVENFAGDLKNSRITILKSAAAGVSAQTKPWLPEL